MKRHYRGKVRNSNIILTKVCFFNTIPNKQENVTNNKTLGLSKFKAFAENEIDVTQISDLAQNLRFI